MLLLKILPYEIGGFFAFLLLSKFNKNASRQEICFALSHIISSLLILKFLNDEYKNIINGYGSIFGFEALSVTSYHYIFDIVILYKFKFKEKFSRNLIIHHMTGIIAFIFLWKYCSWDEPTIICGTIWKSADIIQAFYSGWVIPLNNLEMIQYYFGIVKVSLRLFSYIAPFMILYFRNITVFNRNGLYSSIIVQFMFQFILDYKMTFKFIKVKKTWFFLFLFLVMFHFIIS